MECEYDTGRGNNLQQNVHDQFETSILDLNDHCLLKVFGYLDFIDMINVSGTCKILNAVSEIAAKNFKYFSMEIYAEDVEKRGKRLTALHIDRAVNYIAPIVESIKTFYGRNDLHRPLEKYDFPKLKSLSVKKCNHLRWIKAKDVEKLTIHNMVRNELNNCSSGMTKVKRLKIVDMSRDVPISELLYFFEDNPNIERLLFMDEIKRQLPANFFTKLKNLKMLEFVMGENYRDLEYALQIENLTELTLTYRNLNINNVADANNTLLRFLTSMAQMQTLKSIDLRSIYFDELLYALAPLNLVSLRLIAPSHSPIFSSFSSFYLDFASAPFPALKYLDILAPVGIASFFTLIKHLTALEEVNFSLLRPYDRLTFMEQLSKLLRERESRPELVISFLIMSLKVKVNRIEQILPNINLKSIVLNFSDFL